MIAGFRIKVFHQYLIIPAICPDQQIVTGSGKYGIRGSRPFKAKDTGIIAILRRIIYRILAVSLGEYIGIPFTTADQHIIAGAAGNHFIQFAATNDIVLICSVISNSQTVRLQCLIIKGKTEFSPITIGKVVFHFDLIRSTIGFYHQIVTGSGKYGIGGSRPFKTQRIGITGKIIFC